MWIGLITNKQGKCKPLSVFRQGLKTFLFVTHVRRHSSDTLLAWSVVVKSLLMTISGVAGWKNRLREQAFAIFRQIYNEIWTNHCKFPTMLPPKTGDFHRQILHFFGPDFFLQEKKFRTIFRQPKIWGGKEVAPCQDVTHWWWQWCSSIPCWVYRVIQRANCVVSVVTFPSPSRLPRPWWTRH